MKLFKTEVILFVALLVTIMFVPVAGATGDELHAAPLNPDFISFVKEKSYDSQAQGNTQGLGLVPSPIYRPEVNDVQMFAPNEGYGSTSYPSTYDLRNTKVSPVRNQNPFGTCWAFATFASLESTLMPATPTPDFSEKNLVNLAGFSLPGTPQEAGGNTAMSAAYLTRWNGPVNEATDPYPSSVWTSSSTYSPVIHVQNVVFFPGRTSRTDNDNLKGALTRWGAVSSSLYWHVSFYNETYTSFYQPASASDTLGGGGHAVTIVGWDDTYAATNFTTPADGPGAWIVKNSWGTAWGNKGYFYVSYYDKYFGSALQPSGTKKDSAVFLGESTSNYDTVYSYDKLGEVDDYYFGEKKTGSFANVFTANSSETIKAIGFYTTDLNVPCTISIYKNPTSGPVGGTPVVTVSKTLPYMGYNTVVIPTGQQVPVTKGDKFSVVVQVTNPTNDYYIPVERNYANYTSGIVSQYGQGYVLGTDGWTDLKTQVTVEPLLLNSHVCVKAYTSSTTPSVTTEIGVFRPSTGIWYLDTNVDGNVDKTVKLGQTGDVPIVGDWKGTGKSGIGVFRPSTGYWYLDSTNSGTPDITVKFGKSGDIPLVGDWNKTGHKVIGVFRPSTGTWYLDYDLDGKFDKQVQFGKSGDIPVVGNWSSSVNTEIGVFRPSTGTWYLDYNLDGKFDKQVQFGKSGDMPVVGDWNKAGHSEIGVFRSSTGTWSVNYNFDGKVDKQVQFGKSGDTPVVSDWNKAGQSEIGVFRSSTGYWDLNYNFDGKVDKQVKFGMNGDTAVVPDLGKWA